ncbi:MAG TPA: tetratricopeptide repeat protein [Chthoniobacterales bacterium]
MRRTKPKKRSIFNPRLIAAGVCVVLTAIVWITFAQSLNCTFVNYDDDDYVYQNPNITNGLSFAAIRWAFTHVHAANWHPLTTISHMLDCQVYGLQAWGHHLTNVLLHAVAAMLLFLALCRLTGVNAVAGIGDAGRNQRSWLLQSPLWSSACVAVIWAIHPLRVESVAWISERKDVLSGVFFMLTLLAYATYSRSRRWLLGRYLTVIVLFALGLMCKPTLVTLPFVLLLLDYWPLGRWQGQWSVLRGLLGEKIPLFILSAASCAVTIVAQKEAFAAIHKVPFADRLGNAAISYVIYLAQTICPVRLAVLYPYPEHGFSTFAAILALLLLASVSVALFICRNSYPYLLVGWLWFLGMLVPMSGLVQVGWQSRADRYTYLPQIGLYLSASWGVTELFKRSNQYRRVMAAAVLFVILSLIIRTRVQTSSWQDSETLWRSAIANTTDNYIAHNNLGEALFEEGRLDEAIVEYEKARQINGSLAEAEYNLGNIFLQKGNASRAITHYENALRMQPRYPEAECNLGNVLAQNGEQSEAIYHYQRAVEMKPESAESHANLANALLKTGETRQAIEHYRKAVAIRPASAEMQSNLGNALTSTGDWNGAIACYQAALRVQPGYAKVHNHLGISLVHVGKVDEALEQFSQSLRIDPNYAEAHYNLARLLARLGRRDEAIAHLSAALRLKPDYAEVKDELRELGIAPSQ